MSSDELQSISHSILVSAPAEVLYDMLADVTRMGEWSKACTGATWDDGAGPAASRGMWFTGHNVMGGHAYDAHCEITEAERPASIAWMQGGTDNGIAEWRYGLTPVETGTEVRETWTLVRPFPLDRVTPEQIEFAVVAFDAGIRDTLSRLKAAAEG
jgi:uncharacterized protein YndB with AHSA1/START domain